ncbi:MAG: hypothetical protein R3C28_23525 [Pirellulaceae bacterium]
MQYFQWHRGTWNGGDAGFNRVYGHLYWESLPWVQCDSDEYPFFEDFILPFELTKDASKLVDEYRQKTGPLSMDDFRDLRNALEKVQEFPVRLLPGNGFLPVRWSIRSPDKNRNFFYSSRGTIVSSSVRDAWVESGLSGLIFIPIESTAYERRFFLLERIYHYLNPSDGEEPLLGSEYKAAFEAELDVERNSRLLAMGDMPDYFTADTIIISERARDLLMQFDSSLNCTVHDLPPFIGWDIYCRHQELWSCASSCDGQVHGTQLEFAADRTVIRGEISDVTFDDGESGFCVALSFGNFGELECVTEDNSEESRNLLERLVSSWDELEREIVGRLWECDELDDLIDNDGGENSDVSAFCILLPPDDESSDYQLMIDLGAKYHFVISGNGITHWQPLY